MADLFEFIDYRAYLEALFAKANPAQLKRADLCRFLNCQPSFLSQVISGKTHITLEHAILISQFLRHRTEEKKFFLLLVQFAKAGSSALKAHFRDQIESELKLRQPLKEHLGVSDELSSEDQAIYYSHWWYAAIHILTAFPEIQTIDDIILRLQINPALAREALQFLISKGLVKTEKEGIKIGKTRIHLGSRSRLVTRHHMNWRTKCLDMLEKQRDENIHYSSIIGISQQGALQVRSAIMNLLKTTEVVIRDTKEEVPYVLLTDFFEL